MLRRDEPGTALKLGLFVDHIRAAFGGLPPWDGAPIEAGLIPAEARDENGAALVEDLGSTGRKVRTEHSA